MVVNESKATGQYVLVDSSDPEWVADLFDTMRAGDLEGALASLESVVESVRRATKARRILDYVEPRLLCQGLRISVLRPDGGR